MHNTGTELFRSVSFAKIFLDLFINKVSLQKVTKIIKNI